jgi:hypothetical protein
MQDGCYCSTLCLSRTGSGGALGPALLGGGGRTPGPRHPRPAPAAWPSPPAPPPRAPATVSLAVAAVDTQEPLDAAALVPGREEVGAEEEARTSLLSLDASEKPGRRVGSPIAWAVFIVSRDGRTAW